MGTKHGHHIKTKSHEQILPRTKWCLGIKIKKSDLTLSYQKEERKKPNRDSLIFSHCFGFLFNLAPVHGRRGVDFLFKITEFSF